MKWWLAAAAALIAVAWVMLTHGPELEAEAARELE